MATTRPARAVGPGQSRAGTHSSARRRPGITLAMTPAAASARVLDLQCGNARRPAKSRPKDGPHRKERHNQPTGRLAAARSSAVLWRCKPSQFPLAGRIFLHLAGGRYGDFRDWPAIDGWAVEIADQLDALARQLTYASPLPGAATQGQRPAGQCADGEREDDTDVPRADHQLPAGRVGHPEPPAATSAPTPSWSTSMSSTSKAGSATRNIRPGRRLTIVRPGWLPAWLPAGTPNGRTRPPCAFGPFAGPQVTYAPA